MNDTNGADSTLGIRFDIDRLESGVYRIAAWQVVWNAVGPAVLGPALLFEGETAGTLARREHVFCIAVTARPQALEALRLALEASPEFQRVASDPAFLDTAAVGAEPLASAGSIHAHGELEGKWPTIGFNAAREHRPLMVGIGGPAEPAAAPRAPAPSEPAATPGVSTLLLPPARPAAPPATLPTIGSQPTLPVPPVEVPTPPPPGRGRPRRWMAFAGVGTVVVVVALVAGLLGGGGGGGGPLASREQVEAQALALTEKMDLRSFGNARVESVNCPGDLPAETNKSFDCQVSLSNGVKAVMTVGFADKGGTLQWCSLGSEGQFVLNLEGLSGVCADEEEAATPTTGQATTTTAATTPPTAPAPPTTSPAVTPTATPATTPTTKATTPTTTPATTATTRPTTTTQPTATTTTSPPHTGPVVTTVAGPLAVHDVRLTSRYPEGCRTTDPAGCLTSDGDAIVVMALRAPPGQAEQIMDAITDQAVESTIDDGSGEPLSASIIRSTSTSDNVEVAYTFLGVENPATLTLYWPGNPPITLNV